MGWGLAAGAAASYLSSKNAADESAKEGARGRKASAAQSAKMIEQYEKAVKDLEAIGVPSVEAQKVALQAAELGPSALEQVTSDPRLAMEQFDSLQQMSDMAGPGMTPEDRAETMMISQGAGRENQARQKSILQDMAQRGMSGSGAELAAQLGGAQASSERQAMQQAQMIKDRGDARRAAIMGKAQMAGNMEQAQYGRDANAASAKDRIESFNKQNRANTQNQEQMTNKSLIQQDYQNQMGKGQAMANARAGVAGAYGQGAQNALSASASKQKGISDTNAANQQLIGDLGSAGIKKWGYDGGIIGTPTTEQPLNNQFADGGQVGYLAVPNSNSGFADGGLLGEEMSEANYEGGDIVPGESYEGDRVDAKINSGELVINVEQQQRLMDLLKGLRDLQGLGDEDIIDPAMGADPMAADISQPETMPEGMPPEGMPPQEAPMSMMQQAANGGVIGTSGYNDRAQFEDGGIAPSEYGSDDDKYSSARAQVQPRGIHSSLSHEKKKLEEDDGKQKARKARIKALEVLRNGGK